MHQGRMVFSQVMDYFPVRAFQSIVERYEGDKWIHRFTCRNHFNVMAFAQLTGRESLRDIETCLNANRRHLHHMGIPNKISRNNLAHANEVRDWRIYRDVAMVLMARARELYAEEKLAVELENTIYAFDSTTIDLCLSLFPWAHFRTTKAGIKMHTAIDVRGNIPCFIHITEAKQHDVCAMDKIPVEAGSIYLMDRGYLDFARLYAFHCAGAYFVTRAKSNTKFKRRYSRAVDKNTGLRCDQVGVLNGQKAMDDYPDSVRLISFYDQERNKRLRFLTNNMTCLALDVCKLYKLRWQVELFFKWIKQHLRIKHFFGTSTNAVHIQIWTAVATYALAAIALKELRLNKSMYEFLQFLSVSIFEKCPIIEAFAESEIIPPPQNRYFQAELW